MEDTRYSVHGPREGALQIHIGGNWVISRSLPGAEEVIQRIESEPDARRITFDSRSLGEWDTGLVSFLLKIVEHASGKNIQVDKSGLPGGVNKLLALATAVTRRSVPHARPERLTFLSMMGIECVDCARSAGEIVSFIGEAVVAFVNTLKGKAKFRARDLAVLIEEAGAQALPIVTLISLMIGMILAFVGAIELKTFGVEIFIADLVGIGMAREMGAMMTGVILAGRTGAAYAARLGSMQVNEEVDALRTLGISPMEFLVLPRIMTMVVMTPLLCVYADFMGILGGAIVAVTTLDIPLVQYFAQTKDAVHLDDFAAGLIKSVAFGLIIAVSGCLRGLQCGRSSSAVGDAATSAVVTSIVIIIVADTVLTLIYNVIGW